MSDQSATSAKPIRRRFKTLGPFLEWANQFLGGDYLFRGVPNADFQMEASACRRLPKEDRHNPIKLLEVNESLIEKARLLGHDDVNGRPMSDLELLAKLQHFRAATCLIDFTRDALIALWFACWSEDPKNDRKDGKVVAVLAGNTGTLKTVDSDTVQSESIDYFFKPSTLDASSPDQTAINIPIAHDEEAKRLPKPSSQMGDLGRLINELDRSAPERLAEQLGDSAGPEIKDIDQTLYHWTPKLQNNRIVAQKSVFVFGAPKVQPDDKCVIMKSGKRAVLESLKNIFGIEESTMFPDFDGFARLHGSNQPFEYPNDSATIET